ncbi:MAG: FecR domain-containing protein [Candidatus Pseudobacter hemicellulosilyticus]|uniref:FecR domain-containing protein n=1 Tax=Candidatus Pseudobacter hemicellulosilyticus TaxID=3121375 RepID=A0AAJ5WT74_9BACT|nr:MAG: FecR domain-containing protein [Pseudobacter sp.]
MPKQPIDYYIDRLTDGSISREEWLTLQSLLREPDHAAALDQLLDQQLLLLAEEHTTYEDVVARVQQGVGEQIAAESNPAGRPVHRIHFLRRWGWAAAVLLLIGAGGWFLLARTGSQPAPATAAVTDIAPGRDGAILTLEDGSQLVLDSLGNGIIASQQGTRVKLSNGQLAYDPGAGQTGNSSYNTMSTPRGRQFRLTLPDGTRVWLNAASSIRFPTSFTGPDRKVEISGEAYFEVAKNSRQPFLVSIAGSSLVEVLGTSFNVNAYVNEAQLVATLLEGSVKINNTLLKPGQQALVANKEIQLQRADTDKAVAWKNGLFNFDDCSFTEVMRQLERWYAIEVVYENGIPDIPLGGEMTRDLTLSQVLRNLSDVGVKFRLEQEKLVVTRQ